MIQNVRFGVSKSLVIMMVISYNLTKLGSTVRIYAYPTGYRR